MNSRILVLGKGGQVGRALTELLGADAFAASAADVDFLKPDLAAQLDNFVGNTAVTAVINAAAYTMVDLAEGEGKSDAMRINAAAVGELAIWCKERGLPLIHYSTDYVLPGEGDKPQDETQTPKPLNAYGASKLEGERLIAASGVDYLIFRTSWVYAAHGQNFLRTILRLLHQRESLNIVADQYGAPTYALHLAQASLSALKTALAMPEFPSGIYHLCNSGSVNWHGFAQAIFMLAREYESREYKASLPVDFPVESRDIICKQILPIPTEAYPTPAKRPLNSRLDNAKARKQLAVEMPSWEQGLKECFETLYDSTGLQAERFKGHST
jgi:dTDP-4-dehydrorhamnose reductase